MLITFAWLHRKKVVQDQEKWSKTTLSKRGESLILRRMERDDIPIVVELEHLIFPNPWSEANFRREVTQNQFCLAIVAEWQGEIVGYAVSWFVEDEIHIANIAVSPLHRRCGIGEIFLKTILDESRNRGCLRAFLEVRGSNQPAISLYEKYGFHQIGVCKGYYGNGEDAILMEKYLFFEENAGC